MSDPSICFSFEDVSLEVDGARILDHVDLTVPTGGVTVIAGPSGSGKSTLLRLCNRLEVPTSGVVRYLGRDVASLDPLDHRRRVGMVFQQPTLFAGTVRDNLHVASPGASDDELGAVLERVSLDRGFLERTGDDLSGGEAQRACIARALLTEPEVLLMDEATSALDPDARRAIERLASDLAAEGLTLLWVTHDLEQADRLTAGPGTGRADGGVVHDRAVVILDGRIADDDATASFLADRAPDD
ncbi:MAG: ABC transporter ATP-binding protein [Acidimicrobiales bacterium]